MDTGKRFQRRKPEIPTLKSATTDKTPPALSEKHFELCKVIHLLEDPLTVSLKERHIFVLKKVLKRNPNGFLLKDLRDLAKVFDICAVKSEEDAVYLPFLCKAINLCRLPFIKLRASDELNYAQDVSYFFSQMGHLMRVNCPDVKLSVINCVKSLYQSVTPQQLRNGLHPTHPGYTLQLLERSDLPETLVLSLTTVRHLPDIKLQLLQALKLLSISDLNCGLMLRAQGAATICLHMGEPESLGPILVQSIQILWNLLKHGNMHHVRVNLSTMECLVSLKEAFLHQLMTAVHHRELKLRNYLLMITTLIAENSNNLLIESLFASLLTCLSTYPEISPPNTLINNIKLNNTYEDFQMKKILLSLLCLMANDVAVLQLYREENVILALLILTEERQEKRWSLDQTKELQISALQALCSLVPLLMDEYMSYLGNAFVLRLLSVPNHEDEASDPVHQKTLRHLSLRLLRTITSEQVEIVNQDLCDQGAINELLSLLMQMEGSSDEVDPLALEMKSDIQLILCALCDPDMHRKELFGSEGVEMIVHFLKKGGDRFYIGLGHNKCILSTIDCVRSCIVGCYTTEDFFLAKNGIYLLLDLLSTTPKSFHGILLTTLLELCENPSTASHLRTWMSREGQSAPSVLLQTWRDEETELQVQRTPDGCIINPTKPMCHKLQEDLQGFCPENWTSAAILELEENLRAKIYFIFSALGFHDLPGLTPADHTTLCIIRRYLDFKVGEVWEEVNTELAQEHIRPVTPDRQSLETICKVSEITALRVMEEQTSILQRKKEESLSQEQLMYSKMVSQMKSPQMELTAKIWKDFVSRTSNYEVLKEVKAQRESSLPGSKTEEDGIHPMKHFIGHVVSVEQVGTGGPENVTVSVARVSVKPAGQDLDETSPTEDPEYFRPVSVKH